MNKLPDWWKSDKPYIIQDCLEGMKSIPDNSVDAIVTDPPFGIGFKYGKDKEKTNKPEDYWQWLEPFYKEMMRCLKDGGFFAIWQTTLYLKHLWSWYGDDIHVYISCKNFVQIRPTPINYAYDPIVMKYKEGAEPIRKVNPERSIDYFVANTANFVTETKNVCRKHPCPRPIDQVVEIISNFTIDGGIILDPFLGSGTTLLACRKTDRIGIGFEINPAYEEIIKNRSMGAVQMIESFEEPELIESEKPKEGVRAK